MHTPDAHLLRRWQDHHDAEAFAALVTRYAGLVYAASRRVLQSDADAEDVVQDCFIKLMRARLTVRESLAPWLHRVATHGSLDRLKAERRRRQRELDSAAARATRDDIDTGHVREVAEILGLVDQAIDELPEKIRTPLVLLFLEGRRRSDVARQLGIPDSTVAGRVRRGIDEVRRRLGRRGVAVTGAVLTNTLTERLLEAAPRALTERLRKIALAWPEAEAIGGSAAARGPRLRAPGSTSPVGKSVLISVAAIAVTSLGGVLVVRERDESVHGVRAPAAPAVVSVDAPGDHRPSPPGGEPIEGADRAPVEEAGDEGLAAEEPPALEILCVRADGTAVAGASVLLVQFFARSSPERMAGADATVGPVVADQNGIASFPGVPASDDVYDIGVYAHARDGLAGFDSRSPPRDGGLPAGPFEVELVESGELLGEVVVPDGYDPVSVRVEVSRLYAPAAGTDLDFAGRRLPLYDAGGEQPPWPAWFVRQPDSNGEFRFSGFPTGAHVGLIASGPGLGREMMSVAPGWIDKLVEVHLFAEGAIEGTLTYEGSGEPAGGVPLVSSGRERGEFRAITDAEGRYRFRGLPESMYHISLARDFDAGEWTMAVRSFVRASPGTVTDEIDLRLERGVLVSGRVTDAVTGEPLRTSVSAVNGLTNGTRSVAYATTDEDGRYRLRLPRGESKVYISDRVPEYVYPREETERTVALSPGELEKSGVDFALTPRVEPAPSAFGLARGRVLQPDGQPAVGVLVRTVILHDAKDTSPTFLLTRRTTTGDDGRYELLAAAGRELHLKAGGTTYGSAWARAFEVKEGEVHEVEDLVVQPATGFVSGRVLDEDGHPLAGVGVYGNSKSKNPGGGGEPARTDRQGFFRLGHLVPGEPLRLTAAKVGYESVTLERVATETTELEIVMKRLEGALFRK